MHRLLDISDKKDIPLEYRDTPIGDLLAYHNLGREIDQHDSAKLLIGMCMDNRKQLRIPNNFAFIIRDGGASLVNKEFKLSFAISVGGVKHIAIIGHSDCGMVGLGSRKEQFIDGLVSNAGWTRESAEAHFNSKAPEFEIGNAVDFVLNEVERLRLSYPKITIVPMYYKVEDNRLYIIEE